MNSWFEVLINGELDSIHTEWCDAKAQFEMVQTDEDVTFVELREVKTLLSQLCTV